MPRSTIPAVTHVDYSARVQTVDARRQPATTTRSSRRSTRSPAARCGQHSFNVRGEPIVCTPEDAYRCFMRTEMDTWCSAATSCDKSDQPALREDEDWRARHELD